MPGYNRSKIQISPKLTNIKNILACSYGYKLVCVDDKFSNLPKSYLAKMLFTILLAA